jgi:hypothetical protein
MATGERIAKPLVGDTFAHRLSLNILCGVPDIKDLSLEQRCALHEFFHTLLAATYKLYQVVPPAKAVPIMRKKFDLAIRDEET